jgi:hypothetical protein
MAVAGECIFTSHWLADLCAKQNANEFPTPKN